MRQSLFSTYHPVLPFCYFAGVIALAMSTLHPAFVALSFAAGSCYLIFLKGVWPFLKRLCFALPVFLTVSVANLLLNSLGLTVLFYLGDTPVTKEALVYGMCSGGMLVSVLQWFACYQEVVTTEKFLSLFRRFLPVTAMMIAMIFRYIPDTLRKGREIHRAQWALLGKEGLIRREKAVQGIRMTSILMSWSMENSIETADSMRARGYGRGTRRRHTLPPLATADGVLLGVLLCLLVVNGLLIILPEHHFAFYPRLSGLRIPVWSVLLYAICLWLPLILEGREWLRWKRPRS